MVRCREYHVHSLDSTLPQKELSESLEASRVLLTPTGITTAVT